jgi:hypothetical protein
MISTTSPAPTPKVDPVVNRDKTGVIAGIFTRLLLSFTHRNLV